MSLIKLVSIVGGDATETLKRNTKVIEDYKEKHTIWEKEFSEFEIRVAKFWNKGMHRLKHNKS